MRGPLTVLLTLAAILGAAPAQNAPAHTNPAPTGQTTLRIAAAADLAPVMPAFAYAYEKETGVKLEVTLGSSSALATQILSGAPIDVFLGADFTFPEKIVAAKLADEKLPVPYARGTLVLWARKDLPEQLTLDLLSDPRIVKIAVADQFHAPYGRAAYQEMLRLKLLDKLQPKLVVGENITQTAQFVESGNAQVGFLSLTFASSDKLKAEGQFIRVPNLYDDLRQCGVVLARSHDLEASRKFLAWLRSPKVQATLPQFGLEPVL